MVRDAVHVDVTWLLVRQVCNACHVKNHLSSSAAVVQQGLPATGRTALTWTNVIWTNLAIPEYSAQTFDLVTNAVNVHRVTLPWVHPRVSVPKVQGGRTRVVTGAWTLTNAPTAEMAAVHLTRSA